MSRRVLLLALGPVLVLVVIAGVAIAIARSEPPGAPTGEATAPAPAPVDLVAARRDAGIAECPTTDPGASARPDGLPDVTLPCIDGTGEVRLSALRGKPMIVNLWATWCGPCREEAPHLAAFATVAGDEVQLIGIDVDDPDPAGAIRFAQASQWTWPQLADRRGALRGDLGQAIPQTLFVTGDGRVVHRKLGAFASLDELRALSAEYLGVR